MENLSCKKSEKDFMWYVFAFSLLGKIFDMKVESGLKYLLLLKFKQRVSEAQVSRNELCGL